MESLLLIIRLVLAVVFAVAGFAKLADRPGARRVLGEFGLPAALVSPVSVLLPVAEIGVALLLLPATTAWWGAWAALGLLLLFVGAIANSMRRGQAPECHCFGPLYSAPVGWPTLLRNGLLAVLALLLLIQGPQRTGPELWGWLADPALVAYTGLALWPIGLLLLGLQTWVLLHLLRQNGRLLLRMEALETAMGLASPLPFPAQTVTHGLPVGSVAPAFALPDRHGGLVTLADLLARDNPLVLLFTDPDCAPCTALLPDIARWQRAHADVLTIALISRGEADHYQSHARVLDPLLFQPQGDVSAAYRLTTTPGALLVQRDGRIASAPVLGAAAIEALIAQAQAPRPSLRNLLAPRAPAVANDKPPALAHIPLHARLGERAPALRLPDLDGDTVDLADLRGQDTLVLFWNPGCGFCRHMLAGLQQWETERPVTAPQIVVVSTGTVEENREQGLRSTVVLDSGFATGYAFGARGTPSAVLVDAEGTLASEVVVGAPAVLALAQRNGAKAQPAGL